jgi:hypothetical protein
MLQYTLNTNFTNSRLHELEFVTIRLYDNNSYDALADLTDHSLKGLLRIHEE